MMNIPEHTSNICQPRKKTTVFSTVWNFGLNFATQISIELTKNRLTLLHDEDTAPQPDKFIIGDGHLPGSEVQQHHVLVDAGGASCETRPEVTLLSSKSKPCTHG